MDCWKNKCIALAAISWLLLWWRTIPMDSRIILHFRTKLFVVTDDWMIILQQNNGCSFSEASVCRIKGMDKLGKDNTGLEVTATFSVSKACNASFTPINASVFTIPLKELWWKHSLQPNCDNNPLLQGIPTIK